MFFRNPTRRFRLIDLLVAVTVVCVLLAVGICFVQRTRELARRNQCESNMRQIAIGLRDMSYAGRFPNASTAAHREGDKEIGLPLVGEITVDGQTYAAPGVADPVNGGYSWLVRILGSIEETEPPDPIKQLSRKYKEPAFSLKMVRKRIGGQPPVHFCRCSIPYFYCPANIGGGYADEKEEIYQAIYRHPGISNYVCLAGTHFKSPNELVENGVIVSRAEKNKGTRGCDITASTSKTLLIAETRESNYASWYDGQVNWVTAFPPRYIADFNAAEDVIDKDADGVPDVVRGWVTALNYGPGDAADTKNVYMNLFPYTKDKSYGGRRWGPSSMHPGGVVLHAFADQHVAALADNLDPVVYYALVTRDGSEDPRGADGGLRD